MLLIVINHFKYLGLTLVVPVSKVVSLTIGPRNVYLKLRALISLTYWNPRPAVGVYELPRAIFVFIVQTFLNFTELIFKVTLLEFS